MPILVVTSETRPTELKRMRLVGADAVLIKPAAPDALVLEVRNLLADEPRNVTRAPAAAPAEVSVSRRADADHLAHPDKLTRSVLSKSHVRFTTATPPLSPPALHCPVCDRELTYERSHIGGVSERHAEQWDYYSCSSCGPFQYRQRTRKLRRVDCHAAAASGS